MCTPTEVREQLRGILRLLPTNETSFLVALDAFQPVSIPVGVAECWLIMAISRQIARQKWVGEIVLQLGFRLSIKGGRSWRDIEGQNRRIPEVPGWTYYFHGIGCCVTHDDGTCIDVDFDDEGRTDRIDPYFYIEFLESLPAPELIEQRLIASPGRDPEAWFTPLENLKAAGFIEGRHSFSLTEEGHVWSAVLADVSLTLLSASHWGRAWAALAIGAHDVAIELLEADGVMKATIDLVRAAAR